MAEYKPRFRIRKNRATYGMVCAVIFFRCVPSISDPDLGFVGACPRPFLSTEIGCSWTPGQQLSNARSEAMTADACAGLYLSRL